MLISRRKKKITVLFKKNIYLFISKKSVGSVGSTLLHRTKTVWAKLHLPIKIVSNFGSWFHNEILKFILLKKKFLKLIEIISIKKKWLWTFQLSNFHLLKKIKKLSKFHKNTMISLIRNNWQQVVWQNTSKVFSTKLNKKRFV